MKARPLHDRVIVKPADPESMTKSGIIIPDVGKEKPLRGTVVAVGPGDYQKDGVTRKPMEVKPGDEILFVRYAGSELELNGEEVVIMRAEEIIAIVEPKTAAAQGSR